MGLVQMPTNPKVKDMVIGPWKPKRFNKNPWECKNGMGRGCPRKLKIV